MGPKVTDYEFLIKILTTASYDKLEMDDLAANLMQKDELIEVGVFKLQHSDCPKPEQLPKELALEQLATSIFAGTVYTSDRAKIANMIERRHADVSHFTSKQIVSLAKSLMIEFAKERRQQ
jgi:hypothetical protein